MRKHIALKNKRAHGFMLIEVLVSVLLFSVGVLALVGLQANMTRAQTESKTRADASYLASELIGMMWSDINNLTSYNTDQCANNSRCVGWTSKVTDTLPSGQATVTVDPLNPGDVRIIIQWTLPDGGTHNFTTSTTIQA